MESQIGYYQALKHIIKTADSALSLKKVLNTIAASTTKAMSAAGCVIMLLNHKREHLSIIAAYGLSDLYLRKGILNVHRSLPEIMDGKIAAATAISNDNRTQYPEAAAMEKISSILGAPLFLNGQVVGEIRIYTSDVRTFKQTEHEFISTVAGIVALTLEKNELRQKLDTAPKNAIKKEQASSSNGQNTGFSLVPTNFSHPSEEEFARLLDFYRIEWLYEPRAFPLSWQEDKVTEMFTPDFYLPELDLYIELTTLKQSLITEKNRKVRRLKELFPDVNIRLLNKSDYTKILAKYGYGPAAGTKTEGINQVLLSQTQIQRRVRSLAKTISNDYDGQRLVLVGILKGVVCFMADLMQHISLPVNIEFMAISYYSNESETAVKITKDIDTSIAGQNVLMIEDIVDTGMTLNYILNHLAAHNPSSLRVCALLDKKARRLINVPLDYIGFEVPDEFVIGYGLDYRGEYRNLPFIGILNTESGQIKTV